MASFSDILVALAISNTTESMSIPKLEITDTAESTPIPKLKEELHGDISVQSLELAKEIYLDWKMRERHENKQRNDQLRWVKRVLICQMIVAMMLFVTDFFWKVNIAIIIGLISAITIEFIGLLSIMVKYMYSERSTKSLEVVAKIMGDVGVNNSKYDNN